MTNSFDSIATLSEQELLDHFTGLVVRDRRTTADLLVAIAEIDERKIWARHACSSMFTFCMERFHMSEHVTAKRLWAARTARRFPVLLGMVERGELNLGAIHLLAKHLTEDNHVQVLERAKHKSCRDVERLVAELAPRADVASRIRAVPRPRRRGEHLHGLESSRRAAPAAAVAGDQHDPCNGRQADSALDRPSPRTAELRTAPKPIVPLSPRRFKIEITVDEATHDRLRSLQDLLCRSETGRDPAAIISRAIEVLLDRTLARKAGCTERPRSEKSSVPARRPTASAGEASDSQRGQRGVRADDAFTSQRGQRSRAAAEPNTGASKEARSRTDANGPDGRHCRRQRSRTAFAVGAAASQRRNRARTIPAAVRREVWQRDCGRCRYIDATGHRCRETSNVEFHHKNPFAVGGQHTSDNIELRCAAHNQYQADLDFGRSFMDRRRKNATGATFHGECCATPAAP